MQLQNEAGKEILLVDDDPFVRAVIAEVITAYGSTPHEADHAAEALDYIGRGPVDLVITDINMPGMSGLELVERIRSENEELPIIVLTVNSEIDTAIEAVRKGADDYILKGEAIAETLPLAIAKVFELYDLKMQNRELILDLSRKNDELERLAFLDGLTGIYNRRFYDITLESEWEQALASGNPLALIITDIDSFKDLNDTLGHQYGDLCIQQAAKVISRLMRRYDGAAARFGGDEFIALIRGCDLRCAEEFAETMRTQIEELRVSNPENGQSRPFTMSFGICSMIPDRQTEPESLLEEADKALYKAKEGGRNLVVSA